MANEKFKNVVPEIDFSNDTQSASNVILDNANQNEVSETTNTERTASNAEGEGDNTRTTPKENETTGNSSESTTQQEEEKRGRKPLTPGQREAKNIKDKERREAKKNPEGKTAQTSLMDDLSKYKTVAPPTANAASATAAKEEEIDLAKYISGALLLIVIDAFIPSLIVMVAGFVDPKYKNINKSKLKLTNEEKRELEPLADGVIKYLFGKVHPAIAFLVATGMLYAGKLMSLDDDDFEPREKLAPVKRPRAK